MSSKPPPKSFREKVAYFFSYQGVSDESINQSLLKISTRAFTSVPFQYTLMWFAFFRVESLRRDPVMWGFGGLLVANTVLRFFAYRYGERILKQKNGQLKLRALFLVSCSMVGIMWGGSSAYVFIAQGLTANAVIGLCGNIGATASFIPAASFEIITAMSYLCFSVGIPVVSFIINNHAGQGAVLAGAYSFFAPLMILMAVSVRKTQLALMRSYEILAEKESLIRSMLENIDQAFVLFDKNGYCIGAPSEKSKALLAVDPTGKHIADVMPSKKITRDNLSSWVQLLFLDRLPFKDLMCLAPTRGKVESTGSTLNLKYHAMRNPDGKMNALIFTAIDISQEVKAEKNAAAERERSEMILRILAAKANFQPFLNEFQQLLQKLKEWSDGGDTTTLRRELHTMKGAAMIFGATSLSQAVYDVELAIIDHGDKSELKALIQKQGGVLQQHFDGWRAQNGELFAQLGLLTSTSVEVSRVRFKEIDQVFVASERDVAHRVVNHLMSSEFGEMLKEFEGHIQETAKKLGKSVEFKIEAAAGPLFINAIDYRETLRAFVHLFNNAVDHGLETSEERQALGKPPRGTLRAAYSRISSEDGNWIRLTIDDDGSGINTAKLRDKLIAAGNERGAEASDLEVAMRIFDGGVSTRDHVTELSGQGVGMGSVRAAVVNAGGKIRITRTGPEGTTFEILLPEVKTAVSLAA